MSSDAPRCSSKLLAGGSLHVAGNYIVVGVLELVTFRINY